MEEKENPELFYYTLYCPSIISFDNDKSVSLGNVFHRSILGIDVSFNTTKNGDEIKYTGTSADSNIVVNITYNLKTNYIKYEQIIAFVGKIDSVKDADFLLCSNFEGVIDSSQEIHSNLNYYVAIANRTSGGGNGYMWGKSEFYLGKDSDNKPLSGFFIHTAAMNPLGENDNYEFFTPNMITSVKEKIAASGSVDVKNCSYGVNRNGVIKIPLYIASIEMSNQDDKIAEYKAKCPWTLFDD